MIKKSGNQCTEKLTFTPILVKSPDPTTVVDQRTIVEKEG